MQLQEPIDNSRVLPEVAVGETGKIHFRPFVAICYIELLAVRIERKQTYFRPYCLQAIKQFVQIGADAVFSRTQAFIDYIDVLQYSSMWQRLDLPITDS